MDIPTTPEYPNPSFPLKSCDSLCDPEERLNSAFQKSGLTKRAWAKGIGLSDDKRVSAWLMDPGSMSAKYVLPTCKMLDVDLEWLRYGERRLPDEASERYGEILQDAFHTMLNEKFDAQPLPSNTLVNIYLLLPEDDRLEVSRLARHLFLHEYNRHLAMEERDKLERHLRSSNELLNNIWQKFDLLGHDFMGWLLSKEDC